MQLGDTVKEGDLIAEIDATTQQNQVLNAQASLDQVTASAPSSRPPCAARPNGIRAPAADAGRRGHLAPGIRCRRGAAEDRPCPAAVLRGADQGRETELGTARANLAYTRITAPMDGTVVAVVAEEAAR